MGGTEGNERAVEIRSHEHAVRACAFAAEEQTERKELTEVIFVFAFLGIGGGRRRDRTSRG